MFLSFASLPVPKRIVVCALLCLSGLRGEAGNKPDRSVDLLAHGMRTDAFERPSYNKCPYQYRGYRSVQWLDEERILVAFNTSPDCAMKAGLLAGVLRLAVFDLKGN